MKPVNFLSPGAAVYGCIMNDRLSAQRMADAAAEPPYKGLPQAPVLYVKPRNTWAGAGSCIALPAGETQVEVGAVLGLLLGRDAARVSAAKAMDYVDSLVLAADLSLPHTQYYRPAVRQKCFDGALPMLQLETDPDQCAQLELHTTIAGVAQEPRSMGDLLRSPAQLLADVSEFMSLRRGDVLLLGVIYQAPLAQAGASVSVAIANQADLSFKISEASA